MSAIGLFLDADWQTPVSDTFAGIRASIQALSLPVPDEPGMINDGTPRTGIFIFPDNHREGTLEYLLDECGKLIYRELRDRAQQFTAGAATASLKQEDRSEFAKPAGEIKVTMGCIASFLKPTRAIQTSIEDNRWLCDESLALPKIAQLHVFVKDLIGL